MAVRANQPKSKASPRQGAVQSPGQLGLKRLPSHPYGRLGNCLFSLGSEAPSVQVRPCLLLLTQLLGEEFAVALTALSLASALCSGSHSPPRLLISKMIPEASRW